jgi:hypothetical protein
VATPAEGLALSLLTDLTALVRCDHVVFFGLDSSRQGTWFHQRMPGDAGRDDSDDYERVFWHHYWDFEPCWYLDRTPDTRRVIKRSDFTRSGSFARPAYTPTISTGEG